MNKTIIKPSVKWYEINFKELWQYRDLCKRFVIRDYKTMYKQTVLGPLWIVIVPLLTTFMQMFIFGGIAGISTDGTPSFIFYMAGNSIWLYFSGCLTKVANTFTGNSNILGKVYFPRLILPISTVLSNLLSFLIQFCMLIAGVIYYASIHQIHPNLYMLLIPLLVLEIALLALGCGIIISSLTTRYRDLTVLVNFGVQLWMYCSAVIFPVSAIPAKYYGLMMLNPVVPIIEAFRYSLSGIGSLSFGFLALSWVTTLIVLVIGVVLFNRVEKTFMDTV